MKIGKLLKKFLNPRPIEGYVSEIDQFLNNFDATHAENSSALAEKQKHEHIFYLRDNVVTQEINSVIWEV